MPYLGYEYHIWGMNAIFGGYECHIWGYECHISDLSEQVTHHYESCYKTQHIWIYRTNYTEIVCCYYRTLQQHEKAATLFRHTESFFSSDTHQSITSLSDVLYSEECWTKKSFQYVKIMLPLFRAVVKLH